MSALLHPHIQPTQTGSLGREASSFWKRRAVGAEGGVTWTEGGSAGELCMTHARTKACARQPSSLLYLYLPFARALSPLPACNSAQISEEAGRLIFSVCMAKERGRALTPDTQLLNPPPRPAEGKGKKFISVGKLLAWGGVFGAGGYAEPRAARWPPASRTRALAAGLGVLDVCVQFFLGGGALGKCKTFPPPLC